MSQLLIEWFAGHFEIKRTQDPNSIYICCPFCPRTSEGRKSVDKKFHMGVIFIPTNRVPVPCVHCFRCGYSASIKRFIGECEGSDSLISRSLRTILDISDRPVRTAETEKMICKLPEGYELLDGKSIAHQRPIQYLKDRGVSKFLYQMFEIGFCLTGRYSGRLIFPIYFEGVLRGFTSRILSGDGPKYEFAPGFNAASFLYNFDIASRSNVVVVTEGVFDVLRIPYKAVALFGKSMSVKQKLLLASTWDEVIVMLDPDAGDMAYSIWNQLRPFVKCRIASLSECDPAESSDEELMQALESRSGGMEIFL